MPKIQAESIGAHKAQTRAAILDATYELLTRDPCGLLRREDVAALAGVARTTVYSYFGRNEELILAVAEDRAGAVVAAVLDPPEAPCEDPVAVLLTLVQRCLDYAARNVGDARLFLTVARTMPPDTLASIWQLLMAVPAEIDRLVTIAVETGAVESDDREGLVLAIGELLMGGVDQLLKSEDPMAAVDGISCSRSAIIRRLLEG